jgi:hypothetical protein
MTFKHSKKWYFWAKWISMLAGYIFLVCPALLATFFNFPMMVTENVDSTISIPFVFGVIISLTVVLQAVIKSFKQNTLIAVAVVLAFITAVFICVYNMEKDTIKGFAIVAGCGAIGTLIACGCFKAYTIFNDLYMHCGEVYIK